MPRYHLFMSRIIPSNMTSQRGQSLVEFALMFPIFVFLIFFSIEASLLLYTRQTVLILTGEIAREVFIGKSDTYISTNTSTLATGLGLTPAKLTVTITPTSTTRKSGDLTTVKLVYSYPLLFDALNLAKQLAQNPYPITQQTLTVVQ